MRLLLVLPVVLLALLAAVSCGQEEQQVVKVDTDPEKTPTMTSRDIETVISDSGRTRYRIQAKLWQVFSEAKNPHWTFPNGLVADELDSAYHNMASLICDSAHYDQQARLWSAIGNVRLTMRSGDKVLCDRMYYDEAQHQVNCMDHVRITRTTGDKILTNQMYYDTNTRVTHGDAFIHIEGSGRVIEGYGYQYRDHDKSYHIDNVQGIFPIDDRRFGGGRRS